MADDSWHSLQPTNLSPAWRPLFFRLTNEPDAEALKKLLCDSPPLQVFDSILSQLGDLIKTRHPRKSFTKEQLERLIDDHLLGIPLRLYGVWVYYPWSCRLVHLLDEPEFVELRTNRNRYKLTETEQCQLKQCRIGVVGLSVGQSIALTMALERSFGELRLADFDHLDLSNMNRIRTGVHNLDVLKVFITAREIAEIDPFLQLKCFSQGVTEQTLDDFLLEGGKLDVVVDECDSLDIKVLLRTRARKYRIPVLMDTSDRGLLDIERFDLEPDRPIFHGLVGDLDPNQIRGLSTEDKVPYVLKIIGQDTMSTRMRASLIEVEQTIKTWPQLGSAVVHGGAAAADTARRLCLGHPVPSGRFFIDFETIVQASQGEPATEVTELPQIASSLIELPTLPVDSNVNALELHSEQVMWLVHSGVLAPSGGNCQPWKWLYENRCLGLFHDHVRSDTLTDFQGSGGIVALGAAAENLVLAAHHEQLEVCLNPFPRPDDTHLVATFQFFSESVADSQSHAFDDLWQGIGLRHTNRRLSDRRPLQPEDREAIRNAVQSVADADVQFLETDSALDEVGEIIGGGDRIRLLTRQLNVELMREIRWNQAEAEQRRDGLFIDSLELNPTDRAGIEICRHWPSLELVSQWGGGKALEKMAKKAISSASAVGLLTMKSARPHDYFQGGRALERAWLVANQRGLAVYPMASLPYMFARLIRGGGQGFDQGVIEAVHRLRKRYVKLFDLSDSMGEILLFRLSIAGPPSVRSLRRPASEVLTIR